MRLTAIKWAVVIWTCVLMDDHLYGQYHAARARVYDRGLVSQVEPFSPTGNPALLSKRDVLRIDIEQLTAANTGFQVAISYPLSSRAGLGLTWRKYGHHAANHSLGGLAEQELERHDFILGLGHDTGFLWGQVFEFNYENSRCQSWDERVRDDLHNYQQFRIQYRLGWQQAFGRKFSLGVVTPPLAAVRYRTYPDLGDSVSTRTRFLKEMDAKTAVPLICIEWKPEANWGLALSNRSFEDQNAPQLSAQWRHRKFDLVQAILYDDRRDRLGALSGAGLYLYGFNLFFGYVFPDRHFSMAASFAPERMRDLIHVREMQMSEHPFYPYRLNQGHPDHLVILQIDKVVDQDVELQIRCTGKDMPSLIQTVLISGQNERSIRILLPSGIESWKPGRYTYSIELTAYSKGKQKINRELPFEIMSGNDWSGEPADLVYFLRPDHQPVMDQSRRLIRYDFNKEPVQAEQMARPFYRFIRDSIRFVPDPRPLFRRADRGQYPGELLKSRAGDCEDFSILMISMLQSVGIDASFVEYVRPDTHEGHIFVLFDSNQTASQLVRENKNLQKYIVRRRSDQSETRYYIPLELTRQELSFDEAWTHGLNQYQALGIEENGLADDWFHIIDAEEYQ